MMLVTLYTARIVLAALGENDYGIYNVVGGIVVLFSFLNTAMSNATQRFLSYEIGRGNLTELKNTFSMSLTCHAIMALLIVLLSETIGLWFVETRMNIPEGRLATALWVYQFSVFTFTIGILRVPYNACVISHEKMSFYAYLSIVDVILNLFIAFSITNSQYDRLIIYAFLKFVVTILCWIANYLYCKHCFNCCDYRLFFDKSLFRQMIGFSGWSMLSGGSVLVTQNLSNILLNLYHGVAVNAAYGVANQVSSAIYGFVSNFQMAFQPQIVKLYAENKNDDQAILVNRASLVSYLLLLIVGVPFCISADYILDLWLENVPNYASVFCVWMLIYCLIDAIQAPLWMAIASTGNIKMYSLWSSILNLLTLPISWLFLYNGFLPISLFIVRVLMNIIISVIRTVYVGKFMNFPSISYLNMVLFKVVPVTTISCLSAYGLRFYLPQNFKSFILNTVLTICITTIATLFIALNKHERSFLKKIVLTKLSKQ